MNKKILLGTGLALTLVLAASVNQKAFAVTDTAGIDAVIIAPIVLNCTTDLNFGTLSGGATAGTAVIDTAGARTFTGGTTGVAIDAGNEGACDLSGDTNYDATITIADTTVTGPGPAMAVDTYSLLYDGQGPSPEPFANVTLNATAQTLSIGATLHVDTAANQTPGTYAGTMTVDVSYQ